MTNLVESFTKKLLHPISKNQHKYVVVTIDEISNSDIHFNDRAARLNFEFTSGEKLYHSDQIISLLLV